MSRRVEQVSVRSLLDGVAVSPVVGDFGQEHRRAARVLCAFLSEHRGSGYIEMVKGIPRPNHIQAAVENDNHVADDVDRSWSLHISEDLLDGGESEHPTVRKSPDFMMEGADLAPPKGCDLFVDARGVRLEQGHAGQIELPYELLGNIAVSFTDAPEVAAWLRASEERDSGTAKPRNIPVEVGGHRSP